MFTIGMQPPLGMRCTKCCCIFTRNVDKLSRPDFAELVHALSSPVTELLSWSEENVRVHPQAAVLGAPLEASKDLYPELQRTYTYSNYW